MATLFVVYIPAESSPANQETDSENAPELEGETMQQTAQDDDTSKEPDDGCGEPLTTSKNSDEEKSESEGCSELASTSENERGGRKGMVHDAAETCAQPCREDSTLGVTESQPLITCAASDTDMSGSKACSPGDEPPPEAETDPLTESGHLQMITEHISFEQLLQAILEALKIGGDVWKTTDDEEHFQVTFLVDNERTDVVLQFLSMHGIGSMKDTSVSMFPCNYHTSGETSDETPQNSDTEKQDAFLKTVTSRLTVAQVVEAVKGNAQLTFDYVALLILAGLIAGLGLAENSSVVLVASMLVSPLMGPIMGGTFGMVIRNGDLWRLGLKNEIIGLLLCLVIGLLFGFVTSAVNHNGAVWGATDAWPTPEMQSRGLIRSLWVGVLIAIPSGAGVALSILGGNTGSLVGVAISASLLPPAVNAGMLWAYAIVSAIDHPEFVAASTQWSPTNIAPSNESNSTTESVAETVPPPHEELYPPNCPELLNNAYEFVYRCDMGQEASILGTVSLLLTLLNILCIICMGVVVLKIKEVAPHTALSQYLDNFWKTDIKIARDAYKTMKTGDLESMDLAKLARTIAIEGKDEEVSHDIDDILANLEKDEKYMTVVGKLPNAVIKKISVHYEPTKTICTSSLWRPEPESPSSPRVTNPFMVPSSGLRQRYKNVRLLKTRSQDVPRMPASPLKVLRQDSEEHGRTQRSFYRQKSCPANYVALYPQRLIESKSTGRFRITAVVEEKVPSNTQNRKQSADRESSAVQSSPTTGRVAFKKPHFQLE